MIHPVLGEKPLAWEPGDPCASCGSRDTWWDNVEGGQCRGCGRGDADE